MIYAFLVGLPKWVRYAAGGVAALLALWLAIHLYNRHIIAEYEEELQRKLQVTASEAAAQSSEAVAQTKSSVETSNAQAREAAATSSDPLRAGLNSLRNGAPASSSAAR